MNAQAALEEEDVKMMACASCGITGGDDITLKTCTACKSVRYCSVKCQKEHRPQHKKACKRRAAELRDEILFKQPESFYRGDCPICCIPLPLDYSKTCMNSCCSKYICIGCHYANILREKEQKLQHACAFCRSPILTSEEENNINCMKRVEANDPVALNQMAMIKKGERDYKSAVEYLTRAIELGSIEAHYNLSVMYEKGHGVEKDEKKELYHLECAVIGGHVLGRHNLGGLEEKNGRLDRALKHWIIAAKLGHDHALISLNKACRDGLVSEQDFAAARRGHQKAVDATKSPQRELAEAARQKAEAERAAMQK